VKFHNETHDESSEMTEKKFLTPKGPETIFKPFLKFGQAIVKAIFIKKS
jgi:hypothetical protein